MEIHPILPLIIIPICYRLEPTLTDLICYYAFIIQKTAAYRNVLTKTFISFHQLSNIKETSH